MSPFIYLLVALLAAGLGACAVLIWKRSQAPAQTISQAELDRMGEELSGAKSALAALDKEHAIALERVSRLALLEAALSARDNDLARAQEKLGAAERDLAVSNEARARLEADLETMRARNAAIGEQLAQSERERVALKVADSEKAALLSERDLALQTARADTDRVDGELRQMTARHNATVAELATAREALDQERRAGDEKLKLLTEARDTLTQQFQVLANGVMSQHGETFAKQNKAQIEALLGPFRERMQEFQLGLQNAHTESMKERAALGAEIKQLSSISTMMSAETTNLTRALKGKSQTQGAWGEMVLETLLEKSGLREGEEYYAQTSHQTEEGRRLRPDVIVNLPGGDHVVIDSKVSLVAFEAHINAETDEERALNLRKHVDSLRSHIKGLGGKEYQSISEGGLDYVVMFVPIEGAWAAAVNEDPTLTLLAAECNVAIATPTTLMMALRTVHSVWRVERRNANAEAIAERAGKLYAKVVAFVTEFSQIGARLSQAHDSYQGAMSKLTSGPGNVLRQIEMLKDMGAKTAKAIPAGLLGDDSQTGDAEEEAA